MYFCLFLYWHRWILSGYCLLLWLRAACSRKYCRHSTCHSWVVLCFRKLWFQKSIVYLFLYGATGLLIPASLSVALTLSEGGFILKQGDTVSLDYWALFTNPLSWSIVGLAIVSVLFISGSFLTFYASRAEDHSALKLMRNYALFWSTPTIILALTAFIYLGQHNERHFQNMMDLWWLLALSVAFFMIAMWLLYNGRRYGLAFICIMLQFLTAFSLTGLGNILTFSIHTSPFRVARHHQRWVLHSSLCLSVVCAC